MRERRFREAADALAEAVELNPEDVSAWRLLGGALVALGDTHGAVVSFERALALAPDPKNHYNLALALQASGDGAGARQYLEEALTLDPTYEQAQLRLQELEQAPLAAPLPLASSPSLSGYGYGGQQQRESPQTEATDTRVAPKVNGGTVLAWGVIGLVLFPICSPLAWQMGNQALEILNRYPEADQSQRGSVMAGRTLGIIGTILLLLVAAFAFLLLLFAR